VIETDDHNHTDRTAAPSFRIKRTNDWPADYEAVVRA
jgi:hypothetical protein